MAVSTQNVADLCHRQLGQVFSQSMELLRKRNDSGVDVAGTLSDCDICHINKSQQKRTRRKPCTKQPGPWIFLHRPHGPHKACSKGRLCVRQHVYRPFDQDEGDTPAQEQGSGRRFSTPLEATCAPHAWAPHPMRQGYKGTEYTSSAFQWFCNDSWIALASSAAATVQQVEV